MSNAPLKVLQILPALGDGGVERGTVEMAEYLTQQGILNHVASSGGTLVSRLSAQGIPHHTLPLASKNPITILLNAFRLARLARQESITVFHVRSRAPAWSAWLATHLFLRIHPPAFVATYHGTYGTHGLLKRFYNSVMLKGVVVANSSYIARHVAHTYGYPASQIIVAPRGVDESLFTEKFLPLKQNPGDIKDSSLRPWLEGEGGVTPFHLLCVGRLTRWKGQAALIQAMALVKSQAPQVAWKLAFVGAPDKRGAYARELRELTQTLGLEKDILFLGSRHDIPELNALADLAVSPSLKPEAFGRAAIEAMMMETPVIATNLGGSTETIVNGETGWLVNVAEPGTEDSPAPTLRADVPQALAQTILAALTNPKQLASMGKKARQHVREHFTSQRMCAAELEACRRALARL